jgi:hypothetical protein
MFGFLIKLKTVYEIPEPLSIRERAAKVFSKIEGLDDIKEMMLRALESPERAHTLLVGPPACAKSLFMLEIEKFMSCKVLRRRIIDYKSRVTKVHRGKSA